MCLRSRFCTAGGLRDASTSVVRGNGQDRRLSCPPGPVESNRPAVAEDLDEGLRVVGFDVALEQMVGRLAPDPLGDDVADAAASARTLVDLEHHRPLWIARRHTHRLVAG